MIRTVYGVYEIGAWSNSDPIGNRFYATMNQAIKHLPSTAKPGDPFPEYWIDNLGRSYKIKESVVLETDEDINRLEAAEKAASRFRNLRESEVTEEVNRYRDAILDGKELK